MAARSVCIYAGSALGDDPALIVQARRVGGDLAAAGLRMVYGGGGIGLMGACARAAFEAGGDVLGVIPRFLVGQEQPIEGVPTLIVESMHERKLAMLEQSDAVIALPGGVGTLEELIETLSWARLGLHAKPVLLAGVAFWTPLAELFGHTERAGFTPARFADCLRLVEPEAAVETALAAMAAARGPAFDSARLT
ncbi:MAG: hypothetical protein JWM33_2617 [Caulobacteraceae bacterium]|nr:hypothetical protein [Caulobacteraceae bacterium]